VFCLLVLRSILDVLPPFLIAAALDRLAPLTGRSGSFPPGFMPLFLLLAGVLTAKLFAFYASQVAAVRLGQDLENDFRTDLFRQVMRLRFTYHDENRSGKTIARSLRDMEKAKHFFREVWFGWVEICLLLLAVVAAVFVVHWTYGVVVLLTFGTAVYACIVAGARIAHMDREVSDVYDEVATVLQENVAGARVVRAFGREPGETQKFGGRMDAFSTGWARVERFWTGVMPIVNYLYHLCGPLLLVVAAWRVTRGTGGVGEVAAVMLYTRTIHHRIRPLTRLVILGQQAVASASRVYEVVDRTDLIRSPDRPALLPASGGHLLIEDVHFGHEGGGPVLRGVSLDVPAGGSLGIIGPTGAGKSSLVHLVPRFYDPERGRILLDGIDVRDLDVHALRAAVGLVFQEPFLFSGTVSENVAYGRPGVAQDEIEACVRLAAAEEFVRELPQGYDTVIGERGVSLSGGQRQRLTIARALAMDPRVLIFDDATASVDAVTEKQLFQGIRRAARGRTTIVISQRVTSVRWCDRIAVLDGGVVTAVGTHDELLEQSPLYAEIQQHQRLAGVVP
jgi:ATP-binding cassette subfamily B protein